MGKASKKPKEEQLANLNLQRYEAIQRYMPDQMNDQHTQLALSEVYSHSKGADGLYQLVFSEMFEKGKSATQTLNMLIRKEKLSPLAANYVLHTISAEISGSVNAAVELTQLLSVTNHNIGRLSDFLEEVIEQGADTDLDPLAFFSELRAWMSVKNNIINAGQQGKAPVQINVDARKTPFDDMSAEDLRDMLKRI
jgi:hypothetical protein